MAGPPLTWNELGPRGGTYPVLDLEELFSTSFEKVRSAFLNAIYLGLI